MPEIVTCRILAVTHVGHLDGVADRAPSLDGPGLSVSDNPEAWRRIRGLNAPGIRLTSPHAQWLDGFGIGPEGIEEIRSWAIAQGFMRMIPVWRGIEMDPRSGEVVDLTFTSLEEGARHFGHTPEQEIEDQERGEGALQPETAPALTPRGARVLERWPGCAESWEQAAILIYTREVVIVKRPFIAGVWWPEQEDTTAGTAPSGSLFPERLHLFTAETEDGRVGDASRVLDGIVIPEDPFISGI